MGEKNLDSFVAMTKDPTREVYWRDTVEETDPDVPWEFVFDRYLTCYATNGIAYLQWKGKEYKPSKKELSEGFDWSWDYTMERSLDMSRTEFIDYCKLQMKKGETLFGIQFRVPILP